MMLKSQHSYQQQQQQQQHSGTLKKTHSPHTDLEELLENLNINNTLKQYAKMTSPSNGSSNIEAQNRSRYNLKCLLASKYIQSTLVINKYKTFLRLK